MQVERQHLAWTRGIPPTTEWLGRGGQNPALMLAFDALDAIAATDAMRRNKTQ